MERKIIEEKVSNSLQKIGGNEIAIAKINSATNFSEIGVTSADYIKLIVSLEEEFGIEIEDENLIPDNFKTYGDFIDLLERLIAEK